MRCPRRILALGGFALLAFFATIQPLRPSRADSDHILNIYSARRTPVDAQLYQLFTEKTGITINVVQSKPSELLQRIKLEGDNSDADIFVTVDANDLWRAADYKLLQPVSSTELAAQVPAKMRDPQNRWFAFSSRARVIVYDKSKVKLSKLSTYEALADPKWQSEILTRSATADDIQAMVATMIDAIGADRTQAWARGMAQNFGRQPEGSDGDQVVAMLAGNGSIALCSSDKIARLFTTQDPTLKQSLQHIGIFFPNQQDRGVHIDLAGGGVAAHAPHLANAVKFLEFMVSPEAQRLIADVGFQYPVRADVAPNPVVAGWGSFKADDPRVEALARNNGAAILLMSRAGWQ
ncbi:MAG TPA: extracellular solute-binding protein [Dongiaceae bacterium]|nr:extracellular solute-binding protein [Dongiaceae bacterium]